MVRSRSMPLPNTSPDISPTPATVNGVVCDVDVHFTKMAFYGFPGAPRGDADFLMIVARRPAGREGIVEPEAVLLRDRIGEVGKRCRALVGRNHQIGIIAVVAHHIVRRDYCLEIEIVGEIEQGLHEDR